MFEKVHLDLNELFFWVQVAYIVEVESHLLVPTTQVYWAPSAWLCSLNTISLLPWSDGEYCMGQKTDQHNTAEILVCSVHLDVNFCSWAFFENCRHPFSKLFFLIKDLPSWMQATRPFWIQGLVWFCFFSCKSHVSKKIRALVPCLSPCKRNRMILIWVAPVSLS